MPKDTGEPNYPVVVDALTEKIEALERDVEDSDRRYRGLSSGVHSLIIAISNDRSKEEVRQLAEEIRKVWVTP